MPTRVDLLIVGAQKCGTTTLKRLLDSHTALSSSSTGEPHFFSTCGNWRRELSEYHDLFDWDEGDIHFEKSTSYTFYPHRNLEIWKDIRSYNPKIKIIYTVRNPRERIISAYMHGYERGYHDLSLEEAVTEMPLLLNSSRYASQITPFIQALGRDQVKIIFLNDLIEKPDETLHSVFDFIGVDPSDFEGDAALHANQSTGGGKTHHRFDNPNLGFRIIRRLFPPFWEALTDNSARTFDEKPDLPPKYRRMVSYMLRSEIERLADITGRDLEAWCEPKP